MSMLGGMKVEDAEAAAHAAHLLHMEEHQLYSSEGKIFIGGLSWQTTEEQLREHFGQYGALTDVALMKHKHTGQPR